MRGNLKDYVGLALVLLAVFALFMLVLAVARASAHDRFDCIAAGEGTAAQCDSHGYMHKMEALPGPWMLTIYGDAAGFFSTLKDCVAVLSRYGAPTFQPDFRTGLEAVVWGFGGKVTCSQ